MVLVVNSFTTSLGLLGVAMRLESKSASSFLRECSTVKVWRCRPLGFHTSLPSTAWSLVSKGSALVRLLLAAPSVPMVCIACPWRPEAVSIHCTCSPAWAATVPVRLVLWSSSLQAVAMRPPMVLLLPSAAFRKSLGSWVTKFTTPAMPSPPYWAEAGPRTSSMRLNVSSVRYSRSNMAERET